MNQELTNAAQQALEAIKDLRGYRPDIDAAISALERALTQRPAAQEVDWRCPACGTHEVAVKLECHNSACRSYASAVTVHEGWKATQQAMPAPVGERGWLLPTEGEIDRFLEDYEMRGEAEDGRDACHTPTEGERILIKDAIMGLLSDTAPQRRRWSMADTTISNTDLRNMARDAGLPVSWWDKDPSKEWRELQAFAGLLVARVSATTTYTLIAYRPDGVDTCRNCVMGRSPSDFELQVFKAQDELVAAWAKADADAPEGYEYSATEFTLLLNGLSSDQDYDDDAAYREREQIQARVSAETQRLKAIKLEAAQAAEKAAKRAEEDRREAAERKQLADLQQKYGAKR